MTTSTMAARALAAAGLALASISLAGCSDGIECATGALVLIERPSATVTTDADPLAPGVQTDVVVRSTLAQGEAMSLAVVDGAGATISTTMATAAPGGTVTFAAVTVPLGAVTLRASAVGTCGADADEATIDVIAGADCLVGISPAPIDNPYYAPLRVLTVAQDGDPVAAGFQGDVAVAAAAGWMVELFATGADGAEAALGTAAATEGTARFTVTLPDGRVSVRAVCRDAGASASIASPTTTVQVDTTAPSCEIAAPAPGSTITPTYDLDSDLGNGVQLSVVGSISGGDVAGEAATLTVIAPDGSRSALPSVIGEDGSATTPVTFAPATTPATYGLELAARDHAGNTCAPPHQDYRVVYDGCDIAVTAPTAPVTLDADGAASNGAQLDAALTIAPACAGRTVTTDCGAQPSTAIVPPDGLLTMRLTACATEPCELRETCTFRVTNADGVETSAGLELVYDDTAPAVALAIVDPIVACGAVVGADADVDGAQNGVQIVARVTAPGAATRQVKVTASSGTTTVDATPDATVTIVSGANTLTGIAADDLGNQATSAGVRDHARGSRGQLRGARGRWPARLDRRHRRRREPDDQHLRRGQQARRDRDAQGRRGRGAGRDRDRHDLVPPGHPRDLAAEPHAGGGGPGRRVVRPGDAGGRGRPDRARRDHRSDRGRAQPPRDRDDLDRAGRWRRGGRPLRRAAGDQRPHQRQLRRHRRGDRDRRARDARRGGGARARSPAGRDLVLGRRGRGRHRRQSRGGRHRGAAHARVRSDRRDHAARRRREPDRPRLVDRPRPLQR